ncbi:MAG: hypothetical protein IJ777_03830 [Clostridia bacterium]|nr:hypothetical protein [Clostridia bacterium]
MSDKAKGVLCYVFGWLGGLIFILQKDSNQTVKLHAAQAIVASVGYIILDVIARQLPIPFIGTALSVLYLLIMIFGIVKVCQESDPEIPVVSNIAKSIFKKTLEQ